MRNEDPIVHNHFLFKSLTVEELGLLRLIGDKGGRYDINRMAHTHTYSVDEVVGSVTSLQRKGICDISITGRKTGQSKTIVMDISLTDRGISFYNIDLGMLTGRDKTM